MIKVAVVGVGYLGRFHAQKYAKMEDIELVAVVDSDPDRGRAVAAEFNVSFSQNLDEVLGNVDAASVVTTTTSHFEVAKTLLSHGIHCLIEKPITTTVAEADELINIAKQKGLVLQVGHIERFNPAIKFLFEQASSPLFIEAHRLSGFKERSLDVDVVLDLMIHDIDIALGLVKSQVSEIRAVGVSVLTPNVDIANARLIFESGATANLTASRISLQAMRRVRVFQPGCYISADSMDNKNMFVRKDPHAKGMQAIIPKIVSHEKRDALNDEIIEFINAIREKKEPLVSGEAGRDALKVALEINRQMFTP